MATFRAFILKENSIAYANAPDFEALRDIFRRVPLGPGVRWLSRDPRVTRFRGVVTNETFAVNVAMFTDEARAPAQIEAMRVAFEEVLHGTGDPRFISEYQGYDWTNVEVMPLDPRFGNPSFWTSGEAATETQTWRGFQNFLIETPDNPYGPNNPAWRPLTMAEWSVGTVTGLLNAGAGSGIFWPIAITAGVIAAVYFFGPAGRALSEGYAVNVREQTRAKQLQSGQARQNPRRANRKSRVKRRRSR